MMKSENVKSQMCPCFQMFVEICIICEPEWQVFEGTWHCWLGSSSVIPFSFTILLSKPTTEVRRITSASGL